MFWSSRSFRSFIKEERVVEGMHIGVGQMPQLISSFLLSFVCL
jgi:hypothetical protein